MPLSDYLRNALTEFAQTAFLTPEQQQQRQQFKASKAQQEREFQQTLQMHQEQMRQAQQHQQTQDDITRQRLMDEYILRGWQPNAPGGPSAAPGGPDLTGFGPSFGGGGGAATAPAQLPSPPPQHPATDDLMESLMPGWKQFSGAEQQPGMGMNAPGQIPSGVTTPGQRMPGMGGDSGAGGVAMPAGVIPTVQQLIQRPYGPGGAQMSFRPPAPDADEAMDLPVPKELQGQGWPKSVKVRPEKAGPYLTAFEKFMGVGGAKKEDKEAPLMHAAIQGLAQPGGPLEGKLPTVDQDKYYNLDDVPVAHKQAVMNAFNDLKTPGAREQREAATAQRKASEAELKTKTEQYATQKANAESLLERAQRDPKAWFDKTASKESRDQATKLARERGIPLPTRDLEGERAKTDAYSLDLLAGNARLKELAQQLGPQNLGAIMGRWNSAKMSWGDPIGSSDPNIDRAMKEFQSIAAGLTIREVKQLGGGRAAVQLMNTLKSATPQLYQHPNFLQGAFDAVDFWSHAQMKDNRDYMMGKLPVTSHKEGDVVNLGGKRVRITKLNPNTGDFTPVPVNAKP